VQHLAQPLVRAQADVVQGLVEAGDSPSVHLVVHPVAAVDAHDQRLVPERPGVRRRSSQRLGPVRGQPLGVPGVEAVAERVADHLVGHHPEVPGRGQAEHAGVATGRLVDALHAHEDAPVWRMPP
jgi:hypothetical protein